ncbi:hypothetical protein Tco_0322735 [Tanacetum coccineum]
MALFPLGRLYQQIRDAYAVLELFSIIRLDRSFYLRYLLGVGEKCLDLIGTFFDDLHNNAFDGTNGEEAVKHIEYFLRIVDPIDLPNVNHDKLRVVVFPILLVGGAGRWFDKIKESIDSWVDLTAKFFGKYYPSSCTGKTNTQMIRWDPTNPKFENWLVSKLVNYKTMDIFTKGALYDYWKMGTDEIELTDDESSDLEETDHDDEQEIDPDIFTKDIEGFKTYEEYKDDRIYEWKKDIPWVDEKPWTDTGVWTEPTPIKHYPLEDSELKEYALRNKAIMEGLIDDDNDDESHHEADEREELCEIHELPICNMRRFKMIKYSFEQNEEYVAIKEDEYDDLARTSDDACRAYQEIFRIMDGN